MFNVRSPSFFVLFTIVNIFLVFKTLDFGMLWHATTYVAKDVTVTLNDDSIIKGTLTKNWSGEEVLTSKDNKITILDNYKMLQIPSEDQPELPFPYRMFLPLFIYELLCFAFIKKFYLIK